jgi:hypothetical protein
VIHDQDLFKQTKQAQRNLTEEIKKISYQKMKILMKEEKLQNRQADWESIKNEMIQCKNFVKA